MSLAGEIALRLSFYSIDRPTVRGRIIRMGKLVERALPGFVIEALDGAADIFGAKDSIAQHRSDLIDCLTDHYALMLSDHFDASLETSFRRVLDVLACCEQDIRILTSIGAIVMRSVLKLGARRMVWRPFEFAKCGMAMGSLFSFEISVAMHLQIERDRSDLLVRSDFVRAEVDSFRQEVAKVVASVDKATKRLQASSNAVKTLSADTASQSAIAAASIGDTTAAMHSSANSVRDLESSIQQIAEQANLSSDLSRDTVRITQQTIQSVGQLSGALKRIDDIAQVIARIAAQTNLLALNAAIEAARVGAAGRGFSVVAAEVKTLALQTESATRGIKDILAHLQNAATETTGEIDKTSRSILNLSDATLSVSVAVEQQRNAVREIRSHTQAVEGFSDQLLGTISTLASSSQASSQQANALGEIVADLNARSQRLLQAFQKLEHNLKAA